MSESLLAGAKYTEIVNEFYNLVNLLAYALRNQKRFADFSKFELILYWKFERSILPFEIGRCRILIRSHEANSQTIQLQVSNINADKEELITSFPDILKSLESVVYIGQIHRLFAEFISNLVRSAELTYQLNFAELPLKGFGIKLSEWITAFFAKLDAAYPPIFLSNEYNPQLYLAIIPPPLGYEIIAEPSEMDEEAIAEGFKRLPMS